MSDPSGDRHAGWLSRPELARPDAPVRGDRFLRALEGPFLALDRVVRRAVEPSMDPFTQAGAVANTSLLIAVASGVAILLWYSVSVHTAWSSLNDLGPRSLGGVVRSLHRYSSDAAVFFTALHAARMLAARRFGGPRWLAWVTGVALVAMTWVVGWLGYWLAWDVRAQQVALGTARMFDPLPVFSDPPTRSFLADRSVNSFLFFVVFFAHMLVPLAMAVALWLHITRLNRSRLFTGRRLTALVVGALVIASVLVPARSAAPAHMTTTPGAFTLDAWYLLPLALTDRLKGGALWALLLGLGALVTSVPWILSRGRAPVAKVNVRLCQACRICYEDCPYQAITMVPRTDGRGYDVQARVDPDKCLGCGICAGSCEPGAIGLPWMEVAPTRRKLDVWVDGAKARGDKVCVAFMCGESAGSALRVDPETGRTDALPGWLVMGVPCVGQVSAFTVERAVRHGADGVALVACGEGDCAYREGERWAALRMGGARAPALRHSHTPAEKVRVLHADRNDSRGLTRSLDAFRSAATGATRASAAMRWGVAAALMAASTAIVVALADARYAGPPGHGPELVVTFKHPGRVSEVCRAVSAAERARVPPHMRRDRICERGRAAVRLRVSVDGADVLTRTFSARGVHGDEPAVAIVRVPVTRGEHRVALAIGETADASEWTHRAERSLTFRAMQRRVVLFDRSTGFEVE